MKAAKLCFGLASLAVCVACAETIDVPAGKTETVAPGRVFSDGVLVKTGGGTLDLTGAQLRNGGLQIREGAVKFRGGTAATAVTARYLKWNVTKTRPAKSGAPEFGNSGSQFSEFRLFRDGKMLPRPPRATALNARPEWGEGPQCGIDGNLKTKCYCNPFIADFGEEVTFDGYSFATANDAIGRDPYAWTVEVGMPDGSALNWVGVGSVSCFEAPKARHAEAGKIFPVSLRDAVPPNYPVTVCGKGRLVLDGLNETLECVEGTGAVELAGGASVVFGKTAAFAGSVVGGGAVSFMAAR